MNIPHKDGSLTIDNASVQRLLDYGFLHFTDEGFYVGRWPKTNKPSARAPTETESPCPCGGLFVLVRWPVSACNACGMTPAEKWLADNSPDGRRMAETENTGSGRKPDQQVPGSNPPRGHIMTDIESLVALGEGELRAVRELECDFDPTIVADLIAAIRKIPTLFDAIAHGDDDHRAWLKEAIEAHFAGQPVPEPRGQGRKEAAIRTLQTEKVELREAVRKAEQLAVIASDWNLNEVEIDGEMVCIYGLREEFRQALSNTGEME